MTLVNAMAVVAALGIFLLIWVRTKVQYRKPGQALHLTSLGWRYFGGAAALILLGVPMAPLLAPLFSMQGMSPSQAAPMLRVVWFLVSYYVFIGVHQLVRSRGGEVFAGDQQE